MLSGRLRITVDIGGTFTDLHVLEEASGRTAVTEDADHPLRIPSEGLMRGLEEAGAAFRLRAGPGRRR